MKMWISAAVAVVVHGPDLDQRLEHLEGALNLHQLVVGLNDLGRAQVAMVGFRTGESLTP